MISIKNKLHVAMCLASTIAFMGCTVNRAVQTGKFATLPVQISLPAYSDKADTNFKLNNDGRLVFCDNELLKNNKLNHLYETTGATIDALAMQELPKATSKGKIVLKAKAMSALNAGRRNALLAFGDGGKSGDKMMWAGIYIGGKNYTLQSLDPKTYEVEGGVCVKNEEMDQTKVFDIQIEIDLISRIVVLIVDDKKRGEMRIPDPIKKITHYGYAHHKNTLTYYSDITIKGK